MTAPIPESIAHNPRSLLPVFDEACQRFDNDIAFSCLGQEMSFAELNTLSGRLADFFITELGLEKGERIAIQLPNLTQYPLVAWAAIRAGLVVVNTNPLYTPRELVHQLTDSGARALAVLGPAIGALQSLISETSIEFVVAVNLFGDAELSKIRSVGDARVVWLENILAGHSVAAPIDREISMSDLAVLQYTGGTTGVAKGCMLSHGNIYASFQQLSEDLPPYPDKRSIMVAPMPLYHVYGFQTNVISFLLSGGMSVLVPDPRKVESLIQAMRQYPFTHLAGVNTLLNGLMRHPDFETIDFSELEYTFAGGTALARSVAEEWQARTGVPVYEGYSMSETSSALCLNTKANRELGTVGRPHSATEVKLAAHSTAGDPDDGRGELLVRGPQVMQGYWQRPEATSEIIDDEGWLHTGDIAVIQDNGFVRIVDRLKDMVLVSGFNVYPNEIDAVISGHPDVIDCAAIGVPDQKSGEAVKVFLITDNSDLDANDIREFCRIQLAAYKVPKHIEIVDVLPKSPAGKVLRRQLRSTESYSTPTG